MKKAIIGYWAATALVALAFGFGGIMDLLRPPQMVEQMAHLGYPAYLMTLLGAWKVLGVAAVLAPGLPRLKEWAYAGMVFDLTGAAVSHAAVGDSAGNILTPIVLLGVVFASWALRPDSRKVGTSTRAGESVPAPAYAELANAGSSIAR
ncbi:MAG TPA: DoxX family protein [Polyangiaceae bacterium]|nr:DoxX family protein [Polyangiaceae bacterium]